MTEADLALAIFRYLLPVVAMALALWTYLHQRQAIQDAHKMPDQYREDCHVLQAMVKGLEDRFDAHVKRTAQQKSTEAKAQAAFAPPAESPPLAPPPFPVTHQPGNGVGATAAVPLTQAQTMDAMAAAFRAKDGRKV